ncbi:acyl-CoA dehydrogenase [Cryobacterium sp. SO2]|uniref:acyl-CoA dehydrogenase family protein n=1 Tax=Cryobacterium sp. SO2 TaxID=1897060 RepID=UPI00223DAAC2|nr:acyl-CoA dehydrogenase family protein [Cryobacterium sp. SO2]WEO77752.1 acyl-CoA dehydrogenase [Cryobacterium sp. SO2]
MTRQPSEAESARAVRVRGVRQRGPASPAAAADLAGVAAAAWAVDGDAARAIRFALDTAPKLPMPGSGRTIELFDALATVAAADLTAARVIEAHADALSILHQAPAGSVPAGPSASAEASWGVFAAEGPAQRLDATRQGDVWVLHGRKPWCSLAGSLSHALVTAHTTPEGATPAHRRLFAVDLRHPGVAVHDGAWVATGLTQVSSGPVDFAAVPAVPVGADGWYLSRPGFSWGGIQVAACWWGGAVGVARRLRAAAGSREPDQIMRAHLGAIDLALAAAGAALADAAAAIDAGEAAGEAVGADGSLLAARVRGLVARSVDEVLTRVGHALGPAPLALDARHARRVADLTLYVRQHHAERDDAALGATLLDEESTTW